MKARLIIVILFAIVGNNCFAEGWRDEFNYSDSASPSLYMDNLLSNHTKEKSHEKNFSTIGYHGGGPCLVSINHMGGTGHHTDREILSSYFHDCIGACW